MSIGARLVQHREMRLLAGVSVLAIGVTAARVAAAAPCAVPPPAGITVEVDGLRATLHWPDGASRVVQGASCRELVEAVALIAEMAAPAHPRETDPPAGDAETTTPATKEASPTATSATSSGPRVAQASDREVVRGLGPDAVVERAPSAVPASADVGAIAGGGATRGGRGWQTTIAVGARWRSGRGSLELDVAAVMPASVQVSAAGTVDVWSIAATAAPCVHVGLLAACALASAGVVVGEGAGLADARRVTSPLFALGGRLAAEAAISTRLSLRLRADLLGNVVASRFDVDGMTVWANERAAAWLGADAILRFP